MSYVTKLELKTHPSSSCEELWLRHFYTPRGRIWVTSYKEQWGNSPSITSAKIICYSDHYSCKTYRRTHTCADIREYSLNLFCSATRLTFYH